MTATTFKLVTIICEPILSQKIIELTKNLEASGFTTTDVSGEGSGEKSSGEIPENKVKIEIVCTSAIERKIMSEVSKAFFKNYSLIIYSADITVMRPEKF